LFFDEGLTKHRGNDGDEFDCSFSFEVTKIYENKPGVRETPVRRQGQIK